VIRDYIDREKFTAACGAWLAGTGPQPVDIVRIRRAVAGEFCVCGAPLPVGKTVTEAVVDGVGHPHCHTCEPPPRVTRTGPRSWKIG
jgi:hypothetical protein